MKGIGGMDRSFITWGKTLGCQVLGPEAKNIHITSDTFGEKLLVYVVSKLSDKELSDWINYCCLKLFESGRIPDIHVFRRRTTEFKINPDISTTDVIRCVENDRNDPIPPDPMEISFISAAITLCLRMISVSAVILLIEIFYSKICEYLDNF